LQERTRVDAKLAVEQPADVQLVLLAKDGNAEAFGRLVKLYQRRAVSLAYRLLGNSEDAGDVAQEAFVRAFRSLDQLEDPARFGPWLMRVVSNLSLNFRRSRAARAAGPLDEDAASSGDRRRISRGLRVSGEGEGDRLPAETHDAVSAALEQLPDSQRLALILFSVEGMPQKEVAEVLDCSVELVKWNVFQARKKLKEILADYF
jgi:RNA polymerase sigma-70 factor (ECF subfamily)